MHQLVPVICKLGQGFVIEARCERDLVSVHVEHIDFDFLVVTESFPWYGLEFFAQAKEAPKESTA